MRLDNMDIMVWSILFMLFVCYAAEACCRIAVIYKITNLFVNTNNLGDNRSSSSTELLLCVSVTSDSYLYRVLYRCVVDDDKISATTGACNLVSLDIVLVFIDGFLHVRRNHVGEHCCLCLE